MIVSEVGAVAEDVVDAAAVPPCRPLHEIRIREKKSLQDGLVDEAYIRDHTTWRASWEVAQSAGRRGQGGE